MHEDSPAQTPQPDSAPARDRRSWPIWLRVGVAAVVIVCLAAPLVLWWDQLAHVFAERDQVAAEIRGAGAWGPLLLTALVVAQTVVAPIPGQAVNFVAGYLYGLGPGLFYSWLGLVLGSALALALARFAGRPIVARLVGPIRLAQMDQLMAGRGLSFFFLFFLIPGLPDDLLCFAAGLTRLPLRVLLLLSAIARLPGLFAAVWLGAYAEQLPWPGWLIGGVIAAGGAWGLWRYGERLQNALLALSARSQRRPEHGGPEDH